MLICAPSFYFFTKVVLFLSLQKARHYSRSYIRAPGCITPIYRIRHPSFPLPLSPVIFFFFSFPSFFSKTRLETFARETLKPTATDAMFRGPPINKKTFSRVHFSTLPRVTSKKFRPVKKETGMRSYLDTGLVNIRHVAKGKGTSRACTHVRRDC